MFDDRRLNFVLLVQWRGFMGPLALTLALLHLPASKFQVVDKITESASIFKAEMVSGYAI